MRRFLLGAALVLSAACASLDPPRHKGGIDPSTGVYTRDNDDLVVADAVPLVLRRTYLSVDPISRQFGIGGTHPGEWYLIGDGATFQWAELILSDGGRIRFERITAGTSRNDAVFEHRATPTKFLRARLRPDPRGWMIELADGGSFLFNRCSPASPDICSILDQRDKDGHGIRYVRDGTGRLVEMRGDTQKIAFDYDAAGRIQRARDSWGRSVEYTYDEHGRLVRVRGSDGVERRYAYTDRNQLARIEEPGIAIENRYNADGRVIRQQTRYPGLEDTYTISFDYTVRDGQVVQTDSLAVDRRGGEFGERRTRKRTIYNRHHYRTSEVVQIDDEPAVTISFDRDPVTNVSRLFRVQCGDAPSRDLDPRDYGPTEPDGWSIANGACGK